MPQFPESTMVSRFFPKRQAGKRRVHMTRASGKQRPVLSRARTVKCQICKQLEHKKRSYPNKGKKQETKKRKRDVAAASTQPSQVSQIVQVSLISINDCPNFY